MRGSRPGIGSRRAEAAAIGRSRFDCGLSTSGNASLADGRDRGRCELTRLRSRRFRFPFPCYIAEKNVLEKARFRRVVRNSLVSACMPAFDPLRVLPRWIRSREPVAQSALGCMQPSAPPGRSDKSTSGAGVA